MNAHGEGYVKGFLDAGSIPAGSTKRTGVPNGAPVLFSFLGGTDLTYAKNDIGQVSGIEGSPVKPHSRCASL